MSVVQPNGSQLCTETMTLSCATNSDWMATDTTGAAMNTSIAMSEGRMNIRKVRWGTGSAPVPLGFGGKNREADAPPL